MRSSAEILNNESFALSLKAHNLEYHEVWCRIFKPRDEANSSSDYLDYLGILYSPDINTSKTMWFCQREQKQKKYATLSEPRKPSNVKMLLHQWNMWGCLAEVQNLKYLYIPLLNLKNHPSWLLFVCKFSNWGVTSVGYRTCRGLCSLILCVSLKH